MPKIRILPSNEEFEVKCGVKLIDVLTEKGIHIDNNCGGQGTCGKCKVIVNNEVKLACSYIVESDIEIKDALVNLSKDTANASFVNSKNGFTLLFDLGTTTIRGVAINNDDSTIVCDTTIYNQQRNYGSDVISRIVYSEKNGVQTLQKALVNSINEIIKSFNVSNITEIKVAGNTIITHFLYGEDCHSIRVSPYTPRFLEKDPIKAISLGINVDDKVMLTSIPLVASYVGGDIVSGVLANKQYENDDTVLYIDLGTNGEIVIGNNDWLMCAAASCGPTFEGAGIECGMLANPGAIRDIKIENGVIVPIVIGDIETKGICGTGLINIVAKLLDAKLIDSSGKILNGERIQLGNNVYLTQNDIDSLIRSKGAIFAAIDTLLQKIGLSWNELDNVIISGSFGNHLDISSAIKIGLLPKLSMDKYSLIENGSLQGLIELYKNPILISDIQRIQSMMTSIELSDEASYMDNFTASLFLPHTNTSLFN